MHRVVNEGFDVGDIGASHDKFGHIEYGASEITAMQAVTNYLNKNGLKARGQATGQMPGVLQRCAPYTPPKWMWKKHIM